MIPLCPDCNTRHQLYQAHVFASNSASNRERVVRASASNTAVAQKLGRAPGLNPEVDGDGQSHPAAPKQRWSREAYNAYQREYMRKVRAERRANGSGN